jgi:hypothetical protein
MEKVLSLDHLKQLATDEKGFRQDFFISLAGGVARSSKQILYDPTVKRFWIVNEIDGSFQDYLSDKQLARHTNIVDAIESGTLYKY